MAFDQSLNIIPGPPGFSIFWSSQPTRSGHYVGAFVYGNVGGLHPGVTVQMLVQQAIPNPRFFPNVGFFVVGQPPTAAQGQAFWSSVQQVIATYPQLNTGHGIGMILWLNTLGSFSRPSTFGLFTPSPPTLQNPLIYQLDQGTHRLFDAGGGNRLLSVNANGPAAQLTAAGPMTIALTSPGGPLGLSFGASSYYPGLAVSPHALRVELDVSQPYAGCVGVINEPAGPALRNLELGFEHGFIPQGGLGSSGNQPQFRLFHPLLDSAETLQNTTVTAWLNPLIPTQVATPVPTTPSYNTVQLTRSGTPFVSGYRSRLGDKVTLAPTNPLFLATPCLSSRTYFAPSGAFTLGVQGPPATPSGLMGGLSSIEYVEFAAGDTLSFTPAQKGGIAYTTVNNPDGTTFTTFAPAAPPDDSATLVSRATITPAAARKYVCESDLSPMFGGSTPSTDPLAFKAFALAQVAAGTASALVPLLPQASLDFGPDGQSGNAGTTPAMAAAFERAYVAPTRLLGFEGGGPATNQDGTVWAVTPQGYIAQFVNGVMTSITLGSINPVTGSSGSLSFAGTPQNPLSQNLRNAFLANQQFIVATCLTPDLQNTYAASAQLSGWTFDVSLPKPQDVVPGAYQTVLIIKSAAGSIKSLAAEPYAWTAYATFNSTANDAQGQMLSNWLVAYLAQAETLYANDTGLTGLQTFVELINDPDWNGYIYLHVPIPDQPGALDSSIDFLTAGIDRKQFFAHHIGCALNHTTVAGGAYQANSSYLGLVHYLRPGTNPDDITGTPPYVPQTVDYDFQLLTLEARFENSALVSFRSSAQLLLTKLFGDSVLSTSPDPNVPATDAVLIYGSMQTLGATPQNPAGTPHYVFATAKGAASTFFLASAAFERIEIDRASVAVGTAKDDKGYRTATFTMSGWFGLLPSPSFDVLSYAAIQFDKLLLDMKFQPDQPSTYALRTDGVTLSQMPSRAATDHERITAASAAANIIYRPQSLAAGFPLSVTRLMYVTDSSQTPASLGYRDLATRVPLGGASGTPWYGLEFDLPLGGGGALSSGALFTAKMLFAWTPGGSGHVAVAPYFMLQGPGGANLTLEIEGVLKLGAAGIFLSQNKAGQFVLELASLGITVLSKSFPPAGTTNLLLAGIAQGDQRYLGWFGAYVEQKS
jgi:hypothetical protein